MAEQGQRRKLEAILSADVVGYSRLMQDDDTATVETLTKYQAIFSRVGRNKRSALRRMEDNLTGIGKVHRITPTLHRCRVAMRHPELRTGWI